MRTSLAANEDSANARPMLGAAGCLALVASPVFSLMAWIAATDAGPALCSQRSILLPIDNMTTMYALMSLFHLSPWLKLASGNQPWART